MPRDSKRRMVVSAASLIGTRGAGATSLTDVLRASGAPRGSIYHHFPAGKGELVGEAMKWTSAQVMAHQQKCTASTAAGIIDHFLSLFRHAVVSSQCKAGCPIAGVVVDIYSESDPLIEIGRDSFRKWTALLTTQLVAVGSTPKRARGLATTVLASVEGALILCRAEGSVEPLDAVAAHLRRLASKSALTR